jgi:hypothetical protein
VNIFLEFYPSMSIIMPKQVWLPDCDKTTVKGKMKLLELQV